MFEFEEVVDFCSLRMPYIWNIGWMGWEDWILCDQRTASERGVGHCHERERSSGYSTVWDSVCSFSVPRAGLTSVEQAFVP
jgi:hypothetical protein